MTPEELQWTYCITRMDDPNTTPLQFFDRLHTAKAALLQLEESYPGVPLAIFVRGDQIYYGAPTAEEIVH